MEHPTGPPEPSWRESRAAAERTERSREDTARQVASPARLWDDVVQASALTANDDEHDPEGATVAFERAHLRDMLRRAREELADLEAAAARVRGGQYWVCERCGGPITPARLAARPTARTCVTCASAGRR